MRRPARRRQLGVESLESRQVLSVTAPVASAVPAQDSQAYLWWVTNLVRTNPARAAAWMQSHLDSDTQAALKYFNEDPQQALNVVASRKPRAPLAWNSQLADAAHNHNLDQISTGVQSHSDSVGDLSAQVARTGYANASGLSQNVYAYSLGASNALEAFLFDYGYGSNSKPHLDNITQPGADDPSQQFRDMGAAVDHTDRTGFGPNVVTMNFGSQSGAAAKLVGFVYDDKNSDGYYDMGEGVGGVAIDAQNTATGQTTSAVTGGPGDYQIALNPGRYAVTVHRGNQVVARQTVDIGAQNVERDFVWDQAVNSLGSDNATQDPAPPKQDQPQGQTTGGGPKVQTQTQTQPQTQSQGSPSPFAAAWVTQSYQWNP